MKKIEGYVGTGTFGSDKKFEFEVDDDASEEEIEELATEYLWDIVDFHYWEKE